MREWKRSDDVILIGYVWIDNANIQIVYPRLVLNIVYGRCAIAHPTVGWEFYID